MEQAQIDTIKQIRDTALRLVVEMTPGNNVAELDAMEKLFAVHKHLRQIDYSKLGQLALLPQEKYEPGVQTKLPEAATVQSGEDSLTDPANKDSEGLEFPDTAKDPVTGEPLPNVDIEQCVNCKETFTKAAIKEVGKCPSCLLPFAELQPADMIVQAKIGRAKRLAETDKTAATEAGQEPGSDNHKKIVCSQCQGEFSESELIPHGGVKECPSCGAAMLGDKPKHKKKSKAVVA